MIKKLQFFPRDNDVRLKDAYMCLLILGTFGIHQFYIGNKRRGYYLLVTCGSSHLMMLLQPYFYSALANIFSYKLATAITLFGYALGVPVWIWDFFTLPWQVRRIKMENSHSSS